MTAEPAKPSDVEIGESVKVPVEWLTFDPNNPRFAPEQRPSGSQDDAKVIEFLAGEVELRELVQSIGSNGYIGIEPLIVMLKGDRLVVLEGNRRLASLKVLRDPALASLARITPVEMPPELRATTDKVNVYRVAKREDAQEIIGFKHIVGARPWDAIAKARYANDWLKREEVKGPAGMSLAEIAERMGDNNQTLRRMVTAVRLLDQAEAEGVWDTSFRSGKRFAFSHLYTALSFPSVTSFLGMHSLGPQEDPSSQPVPPERKGEMLELLGWLYGDKRENLTPVIGTQASDLPKLRKVLAAPAATELLRRSRNLDRADEEATDPGNRLMDNLYKASAGAEASLKDLGAFDPEVHKTVPTIVEKLRANVGTIRREVEARMAGDDD